DRVGPARTKELREVDHTSRNTNAGTWVQVIGLEAAQEPCVNAELTGAHVDVQLLRQAVRVLVLRSQVIEGPDKKSLRTPRVHPGLFRNWKHQGHRAMLLGQK